MTARSTRDADQEHEARLERARHDLQAWGRWLMQRTSGALGYGPSVLANLQRVDRSAEHYMAPINETHCSWVDDAVNSLPADVRIQAKLHFGGEFSYRFIAREHRIAPATVSRHIDLVIRTVAYWGATVPGQVSQCAHGHAESGNLGSRAPEGPVQSAGPFVCGASPPRPSSGGLTRRPSGRRAFVD
jgi:hypothetical protein